MNYAYPVGADSAFPGLTPEAALKEINLPSQHQFNTGLSFISNRLYGTLSVSYVERGVLAGRAGCPVRRHDARVHVGERDVRREVPGWPVQRGDQDGEPRQPADSAAHLRRYPKRQMVAEFKILLK